MPAHGTEERVRRMADMRPDHWFSSTDDAVGRDEASGLGVTVDVTGWPVDVTVPQPVPPELRTPDGLVSALRTAIASAALQHRARVGTHRVLSPERQVLVEDLMAGRRRIDPYRMPPIRPVTLPEHPIDGHVAAPDERDQRTWRGSSHELEVQVAMSLRTGLDRCEVDPDFLVSTDAATLRHALREAFADADSSSTQELA